LTGSLELTDYLHMTILWNLLTSVCRREIVVCLGRLLSFSQILYRFSLLVRVKGNYGHTPGTRTCTGDWCCTSRRSKELFCKSQPEDYAAVFRLTMPTRPIRSEDTGFIRTVSLGYK